MNLTFMLKRYTLRRENSGHTYVIDGDFADADYPDQNIGIEIFSWCDNRKHTTLSKLVGTDVSRLKHRQKFNSKKLCITIESLED